MGSVAETARVGCWVMVRGGELEEEWRIVPAEEADVRRRWISEESPLARAVLGHGAGDRVLVQGPHGRWPVVILRVGEPSLTGAGGLRPLVFVLVTADGADGVKHALAPRRSEGPTLCGIQAPTTGARTMHGFTSQEERIECDQCRELARTCRRVQL